MSFPQDAASEFLARYRANVAWLHKASKPLRTRTPSWSRCMATCFAMFRAKSGFADGWMPHSPFLDIDVTLGRRSSAFAKPVRLLCADRHEHKSFQPFPEHRPHLYEIEVFGHPDPIAIEIAVRPGGEPLLRRRK